MARRHRVLPTTGVCKERRWFSVGWLALGLLSLAAFPVSALAEQKKKLTDREKAILKEQQRVVRLIMWARETNASVDEVFVKRYEPMAAACRDQGKVNTKLAKRFHARASQAEKDRDEKGARKNYFIAKLFKTYADQNRQIIEGVREGDSGKVAQACETILKIEAKVKEMTGHEVKRKWVMPAELHPKPKTAAVSKAGDAPSPRSKRKE